MRVFISWSGEPSRSMASALDGWLESILSQVDPWMSDDEIRSGSRWSDVLAKSLDETNYGIICVTRENQHAPWLIFEAGALAKRLDSGRVVPLCIDLLPSDVTGPLTQFQGRTFNEDGVRRLVHDLNAETEKPLEKDRLNRVFDRSWTELETFIAEATEKLPPPEPERSLENMVAEVVDTVRRMERTGRWFSTPMVVASGETISNVTVAASKAPPPGLHGPDLSGYTYVTHGFTNPNAGFVRIPEDDENPAESRD